MKTCTLRLLLPALLGGLCVAQETSGTRAARLPVTEITAFKDGHAFVLRSGDAPVGADGKIRLDDLPKPLLGTFWPAVAGDGLSLRSVTAGQRRVAVERTALELRQLLAANLGKRIVVREAGDLRYEATVLDLPHRPAAEVEAGGALAPALPERSDVVLLRTATARKDTSAERIADDGVRLVRLDRIVDVTFLDDVQTKFADEQIRPQLVLDVACQGGAPATVPVRLSWVEQGFRWIPSYRIVIDGKGQAIVQLQATLENDLVDVENATVHLVVGVPSFVAKGQLDPISLQAAVAEAVARLPRGQSQMAFSNAIMSQVASNEAFYSPEAGPAGAEVEGGRKEQDLYVFTVSGITLRARDRMVVPLGETKVAYRDVWKLDVPMTPPQEVWEQQARDQGALARLLAAPKVRHEIRLANRGAAPFTTAPALVLQGSQVLAQGTMTYTPAGGSCDLELTTAIDILVKKTDRETGRTPNAVRWNDHNYLRIDLEGTLRLANRRQEAVDVEVRRTVFGKLQSATAGGAIDQLNAYDDDALADVRSGRYPYYGIWSAVLNGLGRATWTVHLEPGKEAEVACTWQYYWR
jgi:hypothetical protein